MMLTLLKMLKDVEKTMSVLRFLKFSLQEGAWEEAGRGGEACRHRRQGDIYHFYHHDHGQG